MIKLKELLDAGYKKYPPSFLFTYSDSLFQKCFENCFGKKYFINFIHYPPTNGVDEAWMVEMNINDPHVTIQIHRPEKIDGVEQTMFLLWNTLGGPYYEGGEKCPK